MAHVQLTFSFSVHFWNLSDLKCFTKVVTGLLILRKGSSPDWTSTMDTAMTTWSNEYIQWLETASIALEEEAALKYGR